MTSLVGQGLGLSCVPPGMDGDGVRVRVMCVCVCGGGGIAVVLSGSWALRM